MAASTQRLVGAGREVAHRLVAGTSAAAVVAALFVVAFVVFSLLAQDVQRGARVELTGAEERLRRTVRLHALHPLRGVPASVLPPANVHARPIGMVGGPPDLAATSATVLSFVKAAGVQLAEPARGENEGSARQPAADVLAMLEASIDSAQGAAPSLAASPLGEVVVASAPDELQRLSIARPAVAPASAPELAETRSSSELATVRAPDGIAPDIADVATARDVAAYVIGVAAGTAPALEPSAALQIAEVAGHAMAHRAAADPAVLPTPEATTVAAVAALQLSIGDELDQDVAAAQQCVAGGKAQAAADHGVSGGAIGGRIAAAARAQLDTFVIYDESYRRIAFPMGDVRPLYGVCTDVVVRALRAVGVDLQAAVQAAGVGRGDTNIDHRRTEVLRRLFEKAGTSLGVSSFAEDYRPGDIVTYARPQNSGSRSHIAIVADVQALSGRPMIVHNRGWGPRLEDALFVDRITGHYRLSDVSAARIASLPAGAVPARAATAVRETSRGLARRVTLRPLAERSPTARRLSRARLAAGAAGVTGP